MVPVNHRHVVELCDVTRDYTQKHLHTAAVLLWRSRSCVSRLIRAGGRSDYSHAALALWERGVWCVGEVREWYGGRVVTLESQVRRYPGQIDVYRARPQSGLRTNLAAAAMLRLAGADYGYAAVLRASLAHLPILRLFARVDFDDSSDDGRPPYCSAAVNAAMRAGGLDLVSNLADRFTEPGDIARSPLLEYSCTLVP